VSTPHRAGRDLLAIDEGCACTLGITLAIFSPIEGGMGLKDCTGDRARHCAAANARKLVRKSVSVDLLRHTTRDIS
jgi:hypothetical protein